MSTEINKFGQTAIGYLTNAAGRRTHAIVPLINQDDWDNLPVVKPDPVDMAFLSKFNQDPASFLDPAPVCNPIRSARVRAKVTQEALAKGLGISAAALSKQEQEGHSPRPKTIERALLMLKEIKKSRI